MATVRAKFTCHEVKQALAPDGSVYSEGVYLAPVYSTDPESENRAFWTATPSGRLDMYINNPSAFGKFAVGKSYYLDFTPAES